MAFEEHGAQRRQQRRLAHFIGPDHQVEPVADAVEASRFGELAKLIHGQRTKLHCAADSSFMYST